MSDRDLAGAPAKHLWEVLDEEERAYPGFRSMVEAEAERRAFVHGLETLRKKIGLTQEAVAERMGSVQPAVARLERGDTDPRFSTLQSYLAALGLTPAWTSAPDAEPELAHYGARWFAWRAPRKSFSSRRRRELHPTGTSLPITAITEEGGDLVVRIELPGIDPSRDLTVSLDRMDPPPVDPTSPTAFFSLERDDLSVQGVLEGHPFMRHIPVSPRVTETDIDAFYDDGVLELRVARAAVRAEVHQHRPISVKKGFLDSSR